VGQPPHQMRLRCGAQAHARGTSRAPGVPKLGFWVYGVRVWDLRFRFFFRVEDLQGLRFTVKGLGFRV
jgi:hypothetical protein